MVIIYKKWRPESESNRRIADLQSAALPLCYPAIKTRNITKETNIILLFIVDLYNISNICKFNKNQVNYIKI